MRFSYFIPLSFAGFGCAQTINEVLAANAAALGTLTSLLATVPDVAQALATAQNITILAPSNEAFARLMARNPRSAELVRNPRLLAGVLQYHVLLGNIPSSEFTATPMFRKTLLTTPFANVTGGQNVQLTMVNNTAQVFSGYKQAAMVLTPDIPFSGGVIHVIDTVLTVPANPAQTAINTGLTSLAGALTRANLVDGITGLTDVTIFAPSNDAFEAIGSAANVLGVQDLTSILAYHVLGQQVRFSTDLLTGDNPKTFVTAQGQNLTIRVDGGQVFVNSARLLLADVLTTNGVVHVIDNVLNPGNITATPDPAAPTQAPAFAGVTSVVDSPFTQGIVPTTTFIPANVPLNGLGVPTAVPVAVALCMASGAGLFAMLF